MSQVIANELWLFKNGSTTLDSLTVISRGVDTGDITAADLAAPGIQMPCCIGISPNVSVNTEEVRCPSSSGVYKLHDEPVISSKSELVATFAEVTLNVMQLFYGTDNLADAVAGQAQSGGAEIQGLARAVHYDSASGGDQLIEAWFWTRARLTGLNMDEAVAKPQITMPILGNGSFSPVTPTNLS